MVVKLLPTQIPAFWETIKQSVTQADEIQEKDRAVYFNILLHSLLNDKSQCFVRLNDERRLLTVMVTKLVFDKIGNKGLYIQTLYSWSAVDSNEWRNDFSLVLEFARKEKCNRISFDSRNQRIWKIGEQVGFKEQTRTFIMEI